MIVVLMSALALPAGADQAAAPASAPAAAPAAGARDDGYRGIWYYNQASGDEYVYKYSGGLATYCAKHRPFAVYRPEVEKTTSASWSVSIASHGRLKINSKP